MFEINLHSGASVSPRGIVSLSYGTGAVPCAMQICAIANLKSVEESDQILLFLRGQADVETGVVKSDDIGKGLSGAIMEIWRAAGETAKDRPFYFSDIAPQAGHERAPDIGCRGEFQCGFVLQGEDGKVAHVQRAVHIRHSDVQRQRHGMVARIRRIVTSAA